MRAHQVDAAVQLILTSAVMMAGEMTPAGTPVEMTNSEAKGMLGRERARFPTAEELARYWPELVATEPEPEELPADPPEDPPEDPTADPEPAAKPPIKAGKQR